MSAIGKISGLVIQALKELGKENVRDKEIKIILKHIKTVRNVQSKRKEKGKGTWGPTETTLWGEGNRPKFTAHITL